LGRGVASGVNDTKTFNEGDGWAGLGANPLHVDKNTQSILFLSDEGDKPARIGFSVTAGGAHYYLTELSLAPGETRAIDIRQLRDAGVADFKGHRIPADPSDGAVNWIRLDNVPVSGRVLVVRRGQGMASSFDCCVCFCPDSYAGGLNVAPGQLAMVAGDRCALDNAAGLLGSG
jgi:hypothetical protein